MQYNQPTGSAPNDPYIGKNVAAGIQGSKVPAHAIEYTQREIVYAIAASGQDPSNADLTQLWKAIQASALAATLVSTSVTFWVRSDGDDTHDGLANDAGHAFKTLGAAQTFAMSRLALAAGTITLHIGIPGTYTGPQFIGRGTSTINIVGDTANQANYILTGSASAGQGVIETFGTVNFTGVTIQNTSTGAHTLVATRGSVVLCTNVTLISSGTTTAGHAYGSGGSITLATGCIIQGNAGAALYAEGAGGAVTINTGATLAISGTPTFSIATAYAANAGQITALSGASVSGSATGQRYLGQNYSIINTIGGGANFFPGSTSGAVTNALYQ